MYICIENTHRSITKPQTEAPKVLINSRQSCGIIIQHKHIQQ